MRLLAKSLLIFSLTSCTSLPQKPSVELGVIDYPSGEMVVNMTGGATFKPINSTPMASYPKVLQAIVTNGNRVPLASYDRAICLKPQYWQIEVQYIHDLERFLTSHCSN